LHTQEYNSMIFSIFRNFFANIANLFSSKPQSNSKTSANPQSQTLGSQFSLSVSNLARTVRYAAQNSVTRAVPTLEVVNPRFSNSRKKYIKEKSSKQLKERKYAVGRDKETAKNLFASNTIMSPDDFIYIDNGQASKYHLLVARVDSKDGNDKYFLRCQNTTNGTFKREPLWAHLLFWQNGKDYQYKPMWIPFLTWKCKKVKKDIDLRHGDVLIVGEPEARDNNGKVTNPQLKFVYPPVWYVRLGIYAAKGLLALILLYILASWLLVQSVVDVAVDPLPSSPAPLAIYASDNKTLMAGGRATPHQEKKQLSEFPKLLVQTVMESEDQNFYLHNGINPFRIVTAAIDNLITKRISGGGSTIDQQVARTLFQYEVNSKDIWGKKVAYDREKEGTKDTLDRKIREAGVALKLNSTYRNKDAILLAYFNSVDLGYRNTGESIRGFVDASLFYFNKPVGKLTDKDPEDIARIANLVALLRAPVLAQSLCDRRIEASGEEIEQANKEAETKKGDGKLETDRVREDVIYLRNIRNTLINLIRDRGYISSEVAAKAKKFTNYTLFVNKSGFCQGTDASSDYYKYSPVFMSERVREEVRVVLSITKQEEKDLGRGVFDNYIVVASLDVDKQDNARRLLEESVEKLWRDKRVPHGALITINPKNGEILALVGEVKSPDRKYQYDYAATELIPPASTFKIFFYTSALKGGLPLDRTYPCESLQFEGDTFPVSNYSSYCGSGNTTINLRNAVAFSDNLIPLRVAKEYATIGQVSETARDMGIRSKLEPPVPQMAYGQYKAILREMAGAYAVLANGGKYNFPHAIREIRHNTNKGDCDSTLEKFKNCPLIYEYQKDVRADKQVISKEIADKMTELLRGVVSDGTGTNADIRSVIGKDIAGKTGTSDGSQDGWFIGYIPNELVTGVWLGNFVQPALVTNPPPTQDFNSADAARLWGDYMLRCHLTKGCSK